MKQPMHKICLAVSEEYGIALDDIRGPSRRKHIVAARFMAIKLCRDVLGKTMAEIGRHFDRDHSSINYALRQVSTNNPTYRALAERLRHVADPTPRFIPRYRAFHEPKATFKTRRAR